MAENRLYTVEQANQMLPWLRSQFARIRAVRMALAREENRIEELDQKLRSNGHTDLTERIRQINQGMEKPREELRRLVEEIMERGIVVRDLDTGLVDFRGVHEGREVWLCWREEDPSVAHWHELNEGFRSRRPL